MLRRLDSFDRRIWRHELFFFNKAKAGFAVIATWTLRAFGRTLQLYGLEKEVEVNIKATQVFCLHSEAKSL